MPELKTKIRQGGRLVIPAAYRKALGLKPGGEVVLVLEAGEIRVVSPREAVRVVEIGAISFDLIGGNPYYQEYV